MPYIKGGFPFRVKRETGSNLEIWQEGFKEHRVHHADDYQKCVTYIRENPVKRHLANRAEEYPYGSASGVLELDPGPPRLKARRSQASGPPG